ncbi:MAG: hypothetical protein Q8Q25_01785 [bacterium]|nr:hypothetical protein [bacterium]
MKKILLLIFLATKIVAVRNGIFDLEEKVKRSIEHNMTLYRQQEWGKISEKFKKYDDRGALRTYSLIRLLPLFSTELDHLVQQNTMWFFIRSFGLEDTKIKVMTNRSFDGSYEEERDIFLKRFEESLERSSMDEMRAVERKAIEEVFEVLAGLEALRIIS